MNVVYRSLAFSVRSDRSIPLPSTLAPLVRVFLESLGQIGDSLDSPPAPHQRPVGE